MNMFLRKLYSTKKVVILSLLFAGLFANSNISAGGAWSKPVEPEAVNSTTESEETNSQENSQNSENIRSEENKNTENINLEENIPKADKDTDAEKASHFFAKNSDVQENDEDEMSDDKKHKEKQKTEETVFEDQDIFRAKIHEITEDSDGEIIDCTEVKHKEEQKTENVITQIQVLKQSNEECGYHAFYNAVGLVGNTSEAEIEKLLSNQENFKKFISLSKGKITDKRNNDRVNVKKKRETAELGLAQESVPEGDQMLSGGDIEFLCKNADVRNLLKTIFNVSDEFVNNVEILEFSDAREIRNSSLRQGLTNALKEKVNNFKNDNDKRARVFVVRSGEHWFAVKLEKGNSNNLSKVLFVDSLGVDQKNNQHLKMILNWFDQSEDQRSSVGEQEHFRGSEKISPEETQKTEDINSKQNASDEQDEEKVSYSCDEGSEPQENSDNVPPDDDENARKELQCEKRALRMKKRFKKQTEKIDKQENQNVDDSNSKEEIIPEEILGLINNFVSQKSEEEKHIEFERLVSSFRKDPKPFYDWLKDCGEDEETKIRERIKKYDFIDDFDEKDFFGDKQMLIDDEEDYNLVGGGRDYILKNKIVAFLGKKHSRLKEKYHQNPDEYHFSYEKVIKFKKGEKPKIDSEWLLSNKSETPIIIVLDDGNVEFARVKDIPFIFNETACKVMSKGLTGNEDCCKTNDINRRQIYGRAILASASVAFLVNPWTFPVAAPVGCYYLYKSIRDSKKTRSVDEKKSVSSTMPENIYDVILAPDILPFRVGGYVIVAPSFYDKFEFSRLKNGEKDFEDDLLLIGVDLSGSVETKDSLGRIDYSRRDLTELNLKSAILIGADLSKSDLTGSDLNGIDLTCANLLHSNLGPYTNLTFSDLDNTNFNSAVLDDVIIFSANICNGTSFRKANLSNINFSSYYDSKYKLIGLDFFRATLNKIVFIDCLLESIDMRQVRADMIIFNNTTMNYIDFSSNAKLSNFLLFNTKVLGANINFEGSLIENGVFLGKTDSRTKEGDEVTVDKKGVSLLGNSNFRLTTILNTLFIGFKFKNCIGLEKTGQLTNTTFQNFELEQSGEYQNGLYEGHIWNSMRKDDEIINCMRDCSAKVNGYIGDEFMPIWDEYRNGWLGRVGMRLGAVALDAFVSHATAGIVSGTGSLINAGAAEVKKRHDEKKKEADDAKKKKADDEKKKKADDKELATGDKTEGDDCVTTNANPNVGFGDTKKR